MSSPDPIEPPPWARPAPPPETGIWGPPDLAGQARHRVEIALDIPSDPLAEAQAEGYAAGFAEGRARATAELEPIRHLLANLIGSLERDQLSARQGAEQNVYALALAAARWLFQREVDHDTGVVEALIRRAVSLLPAGAPIEIRANPQDLAALGNHLELREPDGRALAVHWIADPAIERGSFTLASPERLIDGRADLALRTLYERLAAG
jgi:flagellar biosynthesis/type III secretory pathway protein FliH